MTSTEMPWAISKQLGHFPQGVLVGPRSQLSALASRRATVVLPTPRVPEKRNARAIRFAVMAFTSICTTCGCPITSSNMLGRYFRAETWESLVLGPLEDV